MQSPRALLSEVRSPVSADIAIEQPSSHNAGPDSGRAGRPSRYSFLIPLAFSPSYLKREPRTGLNSSLKPFPKPACPGPSAG